MTKTNKQKARRETLSLQVRIILKCKLLDYQKSKVQELIKLQGIYEEWVDYT